VSFTGHGSRLGLGGGPQALPRLFKNCLHLGPDLRLIEQSLQALQAADSAAVDDYLSHRETQLAPLLWWHLQQRRVSSLLGDPLARTIERSYQQNIARNSLLEHGLELVIERFNHERIDTLVLKGASVFTTDLSVFRNAFVLSDVDLLIRPSDMDRAVACLIADGYRPTHSQSTSAGLKIGLMSANRVMRLDLHSALFWTTGGPYLDYGPAELWKRATTVPFRGYRLAALSPEDQLCHRVVHDSIGHGEPILASSTSRLYYFAVLVDFYRNEIDWPKLIEDLERKRSDRLFVAFVYYASRELGLRLPSALEPLHRQARVDVAVLDALAGAPPRLADYSHRTWLAMLTRRTRAGQLKRIGELLVQGPGLRAVRRNSAEHGSPSVVPRAMQLLKILCLQLAAVLSVSASSLRHWLRKENPYV